MLCDPVIEARGLTKVFADTDLVGASLMSLLRGSPAADRCSRPAIDGIDLDVRTGETLGILGMNGAGKTTLLSCLAGVMKPTSGTVRRRGVVLPLLGVGTSFMAELSGRDNAELYMLMMGVSRGEARQRLARVEHFADIGHHFDAPLWTYSSGMAARVAFAAALEVRAETFLIDETLSVGDLSFREKCQAAITARQRDGHTFLLVSHNPPVIAKMCTRGVVLDAGKKVFDGSPAEAVKLYSELRASIEKRKSGVRAITSVLPSVVEIGNVRFDTRLEEGAEKIGVISFQVSARETIERPAIGIVIRASTGFVVSRMLPAPIEGLPRLTEGCAQNVELRFRQRLLRSTYLAEIVLFDLARCGASGESMGVGSRSVRIDILERSELAGYLDLGMTIRQQVHQHSTQ